MKVFKAFIKHFVAPQRSVKTNILVNFYSLAGNEMGTVKTTQIKEMLGFLELLCFFHNPGTLV